MLDVSLVHFDRVTKHFAGVRALHAVSFSISRGEVHGLIGENGAGKSTLGKILAGIHRPDAGSISLDGQTVSFASPRDALRAGIGMVHQELAFCPDLSVAENLVMGQYPRRFGAMLDRRAMRRRARELLARIDARQLDVDRPMRSLSTAQEQLVQIAAALGTDARVLVFDEPTSSLSQRESQRLFELIASLRGRGVTMIYISHRMPELLSLCDRISVLRDGKHVGTVDRSQASEDALISMMIGRSLEAYFPREIQSTATTRRVLVQGLSSPESFDDVSFEIRAGEIVGVAGLVGAGRSEVARALFGLDSNAQGSVEIDGERLRLNSVPDAMRHGLALVPEDRKRQGLILGMSARANLMLPMLRRVSSLRFVRRRRESQLATRQFTQFDVRARSIEAPVAALSGGNQQKIALAKWIGTTPRFLIVDEPTRGVDVGAKAAIHRMLAELAQSGVAILLISSELPELLNLAHRILVMRGGRMVAEVSRAEADEEKLLRLMADVRAGSS